MGLSILKRCYEVCIRPKARSEDDSRREFILNVLLTSVFLFMGGLALIVLSQAVQHGDQYRGETPLVLLAVVFFVGVLLALSRAGYYRFSAGLLIASMFAAAFYTNMSRGVDLPMTWIFYALLVYMAGILIGSWQAILVSIAIGVLFACLTWAQGTGNNPFFLRSWRNDSFGIPDAIGFGLSLGVITLVSWLSNRETDRSLARARKSEAALKIERDSLEIKVKQRTRELKEEQRERLENIERFADFGRLASGILHDLANPLTSMSLNLERAKDADPASQKQLLDRVTGGAERMESLLRTARSQFRSPAELKTISIPIEIEQAVEILSHLAREGRVRLDSRELASLEIHGSPYSFNRILVNVIGNAIEAFGDERPCEAVVMVRAYRDGEMAVVSIEDTGPGIPVGIRDRIFEPFFTTKMNKGGSGMGLATARNLTEREFHGTLDFEDRSEGGTRFLIRVPLEKTV